MKILFPPIARLLITVLCLTSCETMFESQPPATSQGYIPSHIRTLRVISEISATKSFWGPNYDEALQLGRLEFERVAARRNYTIALSREQTIQLSQAQAIAQEQARADDQPQPGAGLEIAADALVFLNIQVVREMKEPPPIVTVSSSGRFRTRRSARQWFTEVTVLASVWDVRNSAGGPIWRAEGNLSGWGLPGVNDIVRDTVMQVASSLPSRLAVSKALRPLP
jgi:hypothetical protein